MEISSQLSGLLLVDKPYGWTSFDCVGRVRGVLEKGLRERGAVFKRLKVGHAGTLDPFATGLLVIAIGKCTKSIESMKNDDKDYVFEVAFGVDSSSFDMDVPREDISFLSAPGRGYTKLDSKYLEEILKRFRGDISQVPPAFSALKINGKRAYELARKGKEVVIEPRQVHVSAFDIISNDLKELTIGDETMILPQVKFFATVSKGTYIRSLARDIGNMINMPGCVVSLQRSRVGKWSLNGDLPVVKLSKETTFEQLIASMISHCT